MTYDVNEKPTSRHETMAVQQKLVEATGWSKWAGKKTKPNTEVIAKRLLELAMSTVHVYTCDEAAPLHR